MRGSPDCFCVRVVDEISAPRAVSLTYGENGGRRGGRHYLPWHRFYRLLERYPLPRPVVVHSVYQRPHK